MTEVLITGGAGFIGTALARRLAAEGWVVSVMDVLHPQVHAGDRAVELPDSVRLFTGDVSHAPDWDAVLQLVHPSHVVHLAAETGTGQSLVEATRHGLVNVVGTTQLLDAMTRTAYLPEHLVLASSRAVYGEGAWQSGDHVFYPPARSHAQLAAGVWDPLSGNGRGVVPLASCAARTEPRPTNIYAATKLAQEHIIGAWASAHDTAFSVLRLQNVYGPGQSLTNPYTGIVSLFAQLARDRQVIEVYEDGRIVRDFVFIDDVVDAFVATMRRLPTARRVLDVGSGSATTIHELANDLASICGAPDPEVVGKFRDGDVRAASCDIEPAKAELDWQPSISLQQGLHALIEWIEAQPGSAG